MGKRSGPKKYRRAAYLRELGITGPFGVICPRCDQRVMRVVSPRGVTFLVNRWGEASCRP